eukprot:s6578_g1.t1
MRRLWPRDCSLCCAGHVGHCAPWDWQHSLTSYFQNLIVETRDELPRQQVQLIAAPDAQRRRQWADMAEEESDSDGTHSTASSNVELSRSRDTPSLAAKVAATQSNVTFKSSDDEGDRPQSARPPSRDPPELPSASSSSAAH